MATLNETGMKAIDEFVETYARVVLPGRMGAWYSEAEEAYENRGGGHGVLEIRASQSVSGRPETLTLAPEWFDDGAAKIADGLEALSPDAPGDADTAEQLALAFRALVECGRELRRLRTRQRALADLVLHLDRRLEGR